MSLGRILFWAAALAASCSPVADVVTSVTDGGAGGAPDVTQGGMPESAPGGAAGAPTPPAGAAGTPTVQAGASGEGGAPMCTHVNANACVQCEDGACCAEELACNDSAACTSYKNDCLKACTRDVNTCILQCAAQNPEGYRLFVPIFACINYHCLAPCGEIQDNPCETCAQASCADQRYACRRDAACFTLLTCKASCLGDSDFSGCMATCDGGASDETVALYRAETDCETKFCSKACQ